MCMRQNNIDLLIYSVIWISGMAVREYIYLNEVKSVYIKQ